MSGQACIRRLIGNRTRANMDKPQLNATAIVRTIKEGAVSLMGPWPRDIEIFIFSVGAGDSVLSPIRAKPNIS